MHAYLQVAQAMHYLNDSCDRLFSVKALAVSGNGAHIASSYVGDVNTHVDIIFLWRLGTGQQTCMIEAREHSFDCIDLNSDATFLATGGGMECESVMLWKIENERALNSQHAIMNHHCDVTVVKFSPDDKRLASADSHGKVKIWSVQSGARLLSFKGHVPKDDLSDDERDDAWEELGVRAIAWSSDSRLLASGGYDQAIQVWDAGTGELVMPPLKGHSRTVVSLCFSADKSLLVSGGYDRTIMVWQLWQGASGKEARVMHRLETPWLGRISISPDSKYLVSGCDSKGVVRVWELALGREIMAFSAVKPNEYASECDPVAVWSPEGLCVVGGTRKSVRVLKFAMQVGL